MCTRILEGNQLIDKHLTIFGVPPNRGDKLYRKVGPTRQQSFLTPVEIFSFS